MANTFGAPYSLGNYASQAYPLYDPREVRTSRVRFRRDLQTDIGYANSLYVPSGKWPSRGWILLKRGHYDALKRSTKLWPTTFQLDIDEAVAGGNRLTFKNLVIVTARVVTAGKTSDTDALVLVELTDTRGACESPWFSTPTASYYNVRAPAYPDGAYYDGSLNAFTPWTWDGMLGDLWARLPLLGAWPGLPFTPSDTPEGFVFPGVSCWLAICRILDLLGCTVACDLTLDSPYSIVQCGAADSIFDTSTTLYAGRIEDDLEPIDVGSARVPGFVKVFFHRRADQYGNEETVRKDSFQWEITPLFAVQIAAPSFFIGARGTHHIWSDFAVRYDLDGNPLAADVATANAIAATTAQQYFDRVYSGTSGAMRRVYAGTLPFATGSQVDGVCWRQDFRPLDGKEPRRQGWLTEIARTGGMAPWPELWQD